MIQFHYSLVAICCITASATSGQLPTPGAKPNHDLERFRNHFLAPDPREPKDGAIRVTFLGTSTLVFDDGETQLMTDGFFTRPAVVEIAKGKLATDTATVDAVVKRARIDRLKALFVAHSHYDHALDVAYVVQKTGAKLHGSASTLNIGRGGGLKDEQMVLFQPGKEYVFGKFTVTVLKGKHSPPIKGLNDDLGQTIDQPLKQPARFRDYKEGGAYDFLIKHGEHTILVNPAGNYVEGALDKVRADAVFLSVGSVGSQNREFQTAFYEQTVGKLKPRVVIPIHWDNFFLPLNDQLEPLGDVPTAFEFLIDRLKKEKIEFGILQGFQSVTLFAATGK